MTISPYHFGRAALFTEILAKADYRSFNKCALLRDKLSQSAVVLNRSYALITTTSADEDQKEASKAPPKS